MVPKRRAWAIAMTLGVDGRCAHASQSISSRGDDLVPLSRRIHAKRGSGGYATVSFGMIVFGQHWMGCVEDG
jgi:hypothetical protein